MHKTIDARVLDLMLRAGSRWVLWLLLALSLAAVAVILERVWFYARHRRSARLLKSALATLATRGPAEALKLLAAGTSMEAAVGRACLARAEDGPESVAERLTAAVDSERMVFERGLAFLGTLGANAPFVGLFGTVLGIVRSFRDLSANSAQGSQAVMGGIAEALVATGVGLLVALPAVAAYNACARHVEASATAAGSFGHEILAVLKSTRPVAKGEGSEAK